MNNNNSFEAHGIDHLSASSINTYIDDPCMWIMRYLFNFRNGGSPAMWRGTSIDHAIGAYFGYSDKKADNLDTAISFAKDEFKNLYEAQKKYYPEQTIDLDKYIKELKSLTKFTSTALNFYHKLGQPTDYQKEINLYLEDLPIPIRGYIDLQYKDTIRDIKTTARYPNDVSSNHARQMSIYAKAEDCLSILDYVYVTTTKQEVVSKPVTNVDEHIKVVERVALSIMKLLAYSNDKYEIASLFYPNFDDWKWSEEEIKFAKTIWS